MPSADTAQGSALQQPTLPRGIFTLSLDFELIWGTLDVFGPRRFAHSCRIERAIVMDRLLSLFEEFRIPATWCVVGHLFLERCRRVGGRVHPEIARPSHSWVTGDWFQHDPCGDETEQPLFYGRRVLEKIASCRVPQEIGSHSFSHVIFGDPGCSRETAASELRACLRAGEEMGLALRSFAFPRNRVGHLDLLREFGFECYRGPGPRWYENGEPSRPLGRLAHLLDVWLATTPPPVLPTMTAGGLWNLPGSMIYFPMHGIRRTIPVARRVRRARRGLDAAARERRVFHLWFHPTNLADQSEQMLEGLRQILQHAATLGDRGELSVEPMAAVCPVRSPALS
jgi:peptidoglycan/xylan/chitin deacetylase (PgdA/CDA1 family)